jgi:fructose/tagatose bisphosphate aldolase
MPLVSGRNHVLDVYAEAAERQWVLPCFCTENLTTTEAVLAATLERGQLLGQDDLPICLGITSQYPGRTQAAYYTHTRRWDTGLKLYLADLRVLTEPPSPFANLRVLAHLDHTQHDADRPLLAWDLTPFSSIMFDASTLPWEENIAATARFMETRGHEIVVEGACDVVKDATLDEPVEDDELTTPERAEQYARQTGVDLIVANLGTEHRARAAQLRYHDDLARLIRDRVGHRIVLHGSSSVPPEHLRSLYQDGVCKVNVWTTLERDSSPRLLAEMVRHAARIAGPRAAQQLAAEGLLGPSADLTSRAEMAYFATCHRQDIVFSSMKQIVFHYLNLWYH